MTHALEVDLKFDARQQKALRYCSLCPRLCRHACPVAHGEARETSTPWGLMRLLRLAEQGVVPTDQGLLETLNHCVSCGRCQSYCLHENPVAETLASARIQLVSAGVPEPERWAPSGDGCGVPGGVSFPETSQEPGARVWLASCAHLKSSERIERLLAAASVMARLGIPVRLPSGSFSGCGFNQLSAGHLEASQASWSAFLDMSPEPEPYAVTDCAKSLWLARQHDHENRGTLHLLEYLVAHVDELPRGSGTLTVAVHDACFPSRRLGLGGQLREVVAHVIGSPPIDLFESGQNARCCGSSSAWADVCGDAHERSVEMVMQDALDTGADLFVTASSECAFAFKAYLEANEISRLQVVDLLDLIIGV
ncbi:MAG: (Fe-S)-binding protein [Myxococcales bacterium]|nr:(Fe-S)-binding protein [Myxococcales bacterium]